MMARISSIDLTKIVWRLEGKACHIMNTFIYKIIEKYRKQEYIQIIVVVVLFVCIMQVKVVLR